MSISKMTEKSPVVLPVCYLIIHYSDFPPQYPTSPPIFKKKIKNLKINKISTRKS